MVTIKKKYGYQFIEKLCSSVEIFTKKLEDENKDIFIYRGANLKHALEKLLYFIFYSDDNLYKIFCGWNTKNLPAVVKVSSRIQKELASILCDNEIDDRLVISIEKYLSFFEHFLKIAIKISLNQFSYLRYFLFSYKIFSFKRNLILFYVVHEKNIRYLKSILPFMQDDYIFYTDDRKASLVLKQEKIPSIDALPFTYNIKIFPQRDDYIRYFGLVDLYDRLYTLVERLKFKKVVLVEGNAPNYEIMNLVCKQQGIPTVCIQNGWPSFMHTGLRNMSYTKMLVWGKGFITLHKPFNPKQLFIATGSHIINIKGRRKNKDLKKRAISFFLQPPNRLADEEDLGQMLDLIKWTALEFPKFLIIIREHPISNLSDYDKNQFNIYSNIRFMPSQEYKLSEVMDLSYLAVSIFSSTILESIASDVLPLIFNITSKPKYYPDVDASRAGVEVKDLRNAKIIIKKLIENEKYYKSFQPGMRKLKKELFSAGGATAIKHIVKEIGKD